MQFKLEGKDMVRKVAARTGGGAHVFVPKKWTGKEVIAILVG